MVTHAHNITLVNIHPPFIFFSMRVKGHIKYSLPVAKQISIMASCGVQLWRTLTGEVIATTNSKDILKQATNQWNDFLLGSHSALPTYRLGTQWSFAMCDCTLNIWCISQSVQQGHCGKVLFSMAPHPSFWWMQGGSSSCWWCTSEEIACMRACVLSFWHALSGTLKTYMTSLWLNRPVA